MSLLTSTRELIDNTLALIHASNFTFREIADGSGVKIDWLLKFAYGKIATPGVDKVEPVYKFLSEPPKRAGKRRHSSQVAA